MLTNTMRYSRLPYEAFQLCNWSFQTYDEWLSLNMLVLAVITKFPSKAYVCDNDQTVYVCGISDQGGCFHINSCRRSFTLNANIFYFVSDYIIILQCNYVKKLLECVLYDYKSSKCCLFTLFQINHLYILQTFW